MSDCEICTCGHYRGMHLFGLSEAMVLDGSCMICKAGDYKYPCRGFDPVLKPAPADPARVQSDEPAQVDGSAT